MSDETDEHDLRILADSYLVLHDPEAFDRMVASWDAKLDALGYGPVPLRPDAPLATQYKVLRGLLSRLGVPDPADPITRTVHRVNEPAIVLTRSLRIVAVNAAGKDHFRADTGTIASLDFLDPEQAKILREILRSLAVERPVNGFYRILTTRAPDGGRSYAEVFPIVDSGLSERVLSIRLLSPDWDPKMDHVLSEAFGLTEAETEVARLMFLHVDLVRVAELRGVTLRTARAQLGRLFAKTETGTQAELIRLMSHISSRLGAQTDRRALVWSDPYRREEVMIRPGGHRLAYTWIGAENGAPALYLPGVVNGYVYPEVFERTLKEAGVKLWVLTRPGAGHSDRVPETEPLDDYMEAIRHFCQKMNLRGLPAIGVHSINVALVRLATEPVPLFSEIITLGRFLSLSGQTFRKVPTLPRAMLWLAAHSPWAAEIVGIQGHRSLVASGVDWYIDRAYGDMPFDYALTRDPDISAMLRDACGYTFLQSHHPFMDDLRVRQVDVRPDLGRLRIPMTWLLGAIEVYSRDQSRGFFYDPEELARLERSTDRLTVVPVDNAADLLPYQAPQIVAETIRDAALRAARAERAL